MPVRSLRKKKIFIWIPPSVTANFLMTVERADGTVDDITDFLASWEIIPGVNDSIGTFSFTFWNPNETFNSKWAAMDIFRFFCDYSTTASTLRFRGRFEKVSPKNNQIVVSGRGEARHFVDKKVTASFVNTELSVILTSIFDVHNDGSFTKAGVEVGTKTLSIEWNRKPFWDCVRDIVESGGTTCFIDALKDLQYFIAGSRDNVEDAIVHDHNLLETGDFAPDVSLVRNRIRVLGAVIGGIQLVYTAEDLASQTDFDIRVEDFEDTSLRTYVALQEFGDFKLSLLKDPPIVGEVKAVLLATIQPGQRLRVSDPSNGLAPGFYNMVGFKHEGGDSGFFTAAFLNKEPRKSNRVIRDIIQRQNRNRDASTNPNDMEFSYPFFFDEDVGSHDANTEITGGVLKLKSGQSSGTWISPSRTLPRNGEKVQVNLIGQTLTGVALQVSFNGGVDFESVTAGSLFTLSSSVGTIFQIKVVFSSAAAQVDSLNGLYKLVAA